MESLERAERITFGLFEVDLQSGEIWKSGHRVRLQDQPFRVLAALLTKPGQVVTHSELQLQVWGPDTNVDFERALAVAIKKIREALSDSAENPRFVETLAKRGYRFIAPVTLTPIALPPVPVNGTDAGLEKLEIHPRQFPPFTAQDSASVPFSNTSTPIRPPIQGPEPDASNTQPAASKTVRKIHVWSRREILLALASALLLGLGTVLWLLGHPASLPPLRVEQLTHDSPVSAGPPSMENLLTLATDGERVFAPVMISGKPQLAAIDISTGAVQPLTIPTQLSSARVADISRDGSHLLLRSQLSTQSEQPLWIVPTAGGGALRVGNVLAQDATWMPDGTSILFANGNELNQIRLDGGTITPIARLGGRAFWLRWSPDGAILRFTVMDPLTHTGSLWELKRGSKTPRPLLKTYRDPSRLS